MIRAYDLSCMQDVVNQQLNDPFMRLINLRISCSEETAYTVASIRMVPCEERQTRFYRYVERYLFIGGAGHPKVDERLSDPNVRLLNQYVFPTAEGTVCVLDYQVRKGVDKQYGTV